jgi:hypothetical protein
MSKSRESMHMIYEATRGFPHTQRFWSSIQILGETDCWEIKTEPDSGGYGRFRIKKINFIAHRIAYYLATGESPQVVMHSCDNRRCCNPAHLRAGTHSENVRDMIAKGRWDKTKIKFGGGSRPYLYRDLEIAWRTGKFTAHELANIFALSPRAVWNSAQYPNRRNGKGMI